ncbi:alkylation response protein AidB-like acyl-CoA dehydrogenase [Catenulispora sp. GAS73]|uniref:acyl-CoA dehydrogenase family protein n=1 Tax=Catenulispora sp. GAS73 TaxID=3156269 RepID=UPI003518B6E2
MDFRPTPDQRALAGAVRDVLSKHPAPGTPGQETEEGPEPGIGGVAVALWRDLAELGIFGVRVPEAAGGLGLGHPESVHVFEELGRALATGPFTATALAAPLLPEYAGGRYRVGLGDLTCGDQQTQILEHLDALDALLVIEIVDGETPGVAGHSQVLRVEPIELRADPVPHPVDPRVPLHRLRQKPLRGEIVGDAGTADALLREGALLTAAYQVGIAAVLTERAVAYAKQRTQFGRAIGSFQAVKHLCADMFARAELARAAVHSAAVLLSDEAAGHDGTDLPTAAAAVSTAKLLADEAAVANARSAIQVHGGMGCTWEMGLHLYLKRAWALSLAYGRAAEHADLISESL